MIYLGKFKIIENYITACDYDFVLNKIGEAIGNKNTLLISPIASHTLVRAKHNQKLKEILDNFDYLVPDSQWVKRAIWFLYGKRLKKRVYGPDLMLKICDFSQHKNWRIFLYGNKKEVLDQLELKLKEKFKKIKISGKEESKFRELTKSEMKELGEKINKSKTDIVFISLGSPKQEIFAYELKKYLKTSKILIPVGAAFDFISGVKKQAPRWMGEWGLEWSWRLINESGLLKRYLCYGMFFIFLLIKQKLWIKE